MSTQTQSKPVAAGAESPESTPAQAVVQKAISEITHIATLPEVTLKIVKLVEDPDSTAQDLNNVISHDPALGARILKVVNSAFYGLPGQIGSINRAIVLLGMNAVKNIAIAASLAKLFRGGAICPQFNARDLWTHSIAVAACTRLLSKRIRLGLPDEAFLGGLIHDLGLMVEMQARRPQLVEAFQQMERRPELTLRQAEIEAMGASHEDFGAGLCKLWKFPASFIYVTGHHHHPRDVHPRNRSLVGLVHVSDVISARLMLGFTRSVETTELDTELLQELNITPEIIAEVEKELPAAIQEATALLQDGGA